MTPEPANTAPDRMPFSVSLMALMVGATEFVEYDAPRCLLCRLIQSVGGKACVGHRRAA